MNVVHLEDSTLGAIVSYKEVQKYYDNTDMDVSKCDGTIYRQKGGKFYLKVLENFGEDYLSVNTVSDLKGLSFLNILLLRMGYYKGVLLCGYYSKGDTINPIVYVLKNGVSVDNGGRIIKFSENEYFECNSLKGAVEVKYYGIFPDMTDCSFGLKNICDDKSVNTLLFGGGTYTFTSSSKFWFKNMRGYFLDTKVNFTHKDGGFKIYVDETLPLGSRGIGGIGDVQDIIFSGHSNCDSFVSLWRATEGYFKNCYFHGFKRVFDIGGAFDICHFVNCVFTSCSDVFYVRDGAEPYIGLNSVTLFGGNFFNIQNLVSTSVGGNFRVTGAWFEKTNCILRERGSNGGNTVNLSYCDIVKSPSQDEYTVNDNEPLFVLSNDSISYIQLIQNNIKSYFAHDLIKIVKYSASTDIAIKNIELNANRFWGDSLQTVLKADGLTSLYLCTVTAKDNYFDFGYSWRYDLPSKIPSGVQLTGNQNGIHFGLRLGVSDLSFIRFENDTKKLYVTDDNGVKKYFQFTN